MSEEIVKENNKGNLYLASVIAIPGKNPRLCVYGQYKTN